MDYSSLQIISISLAVFIVGTCGLLGGDDVLACFIAGGFLCVDQVELFAPVERKENGIMGVVRMVVFLWAGMVAPWGEFVGAEGMGLMGLGVTVLVLKRLPGVMGLRKWVLPFEEAKEATVLGLVAPIGVSSIAYLIVMTDFLREMAASKELSGESRQLVEQAIRVGGMVVWGVVVVTVIGYGITIPLIMVSKVQTRVPIFITSQIANPYSSPKP